MACVGGKLHLLFTYGTLKKGEANAHFMSDKNNGHCRFIGHARTVQKYPMVLLTSYYFPFLLDVPGKGDVCAINYCHKLKKSEKPMYPIHLYLTENYCFCFFLVLI